jgi:nucleotide-binding universal stress UspA family protein
MVACDAPAPCHANANGSAPSGCDLIVIGTHGRHEISRVLLSSDAERVLRQSTMPVLLVRDTNKQAA